jgi:glycosyltransferase involved in cell wall biosynthesis
MSSELNKFFKGKKILVTDGAGSNRREIVKEPFFSILIPTKNRSEYLKYAINSVLNQTFNDFEIVISDNNSTDDTQKIVKGYKDKRLKYFNTEKDVLIADNWNNAFNNSECKYIILMGDDDYQFPTFLEELKKGIDRYGNPDIIYTRCADYNYKKNKLSIQQSISNETREESWETYIDKMFNKFDIPSGTGTCFSRSVANKVKKEGKLFVGPAPDFYGFTSMAMHANKIIKVDKLKWIAAKTPKSMSYFQSSYSAINKVLNEDKLQDHIKTPLPGNTLPNVIYYAIVLIKNRYPEKTKNRKINMKLYYDFFGRMFGTSIADSIKNTGKFKAIMKEFNVFVKKSPKKIVIKCLFFWIPSRIISNLISSMLIPEREKDKIRDVLAKLIREGVGVKNIYLKEKSNIEDAAKVMLQYLDDAEKHL